MAPSPGTGELNVSSRRGLLVSVVQYVVGLLALAWLLGQVDLARLGELLGSVEPSTIVALLVVTGVGLLARFYTWHVLIERVSGAGFLTSAGVDLAVNFVNQLLPSRLSGRAAAPLVLRGHTGMGYAPAVAVAGAHTGLYAVLYAVGALAGLLLGVGRFSTGLLALLALSTGLYLLAGAFVLLAGTNMTAANRAVGALGALLARIPAVGERLADRVRSAPGFTEASSDWFRRLATDPTVVLPYAAGFGVAMVLAPGLRVWFLLTSLGTGFSPALALPLYLLVAYSVTLLPLTPGGIGVSEATATAVFVALGVPAEVIVPVVFVDRLLGVYLPALAGWYPSARLDVAGLVAE